jgi:indoleamine 2,3-dioxygenase
MPLPESTPSLHAPDATAPPSQPRALDLARFGVDPLRGFLPPVDPLARLPAAYALWDEIAAELPKLLAAEKLRATIDRLPILDTAPLTGPALDRAMLLLSFFGHGYVWEQWRETAHTKLPPGLAVPWSQVAERLGRPPVLSYASYALANWRRLDPAGPIALGNVALLVNFLGGLDEEWFVGVHVDIEAKAGPLLAAIGPAQRAVTDNQPAALEQPLRAMAGHLEQIYATLRRMPENCDPYIYYNRVRPYIHGFTENPVIYEGVAAYAGQPQAFYGETGAQSSIIPALDAALGIGHTPDQLRTYLTHMRDYMPPGHRAFLAAIEAGPAIRPYVLAHPDASLREAYDAVVALVERFRAKHLEYAATYIHQQSQRGTNSTHYGTGGTPFMKYLKKHRDETAEHLIHP